MMFDRELELHPDIGGLAHFECLDLVLCAKCTYLRCGHIHYTYTGRRSMLVQYKYTTDASMYNCKWGPAQPGE